MAIYAIGHDIVENDRIKKIFEAHPTQFIKKTLSDNEQKQLLCKQDPVKFLAKRFAAKEAFAKACGTGFRDPILMPNISIMNDDLGKPYFILDNKIKDWLRAKGIIYHHLSISDEKYLSSAFVILEQ